MNQRLNKNLVLLIFVILTITSLYQFFYKYSVEALHHSLLSSIKISREIHTAENFHGSIHNMLYLASNNESTEKMKNEYYKQKEKAALQIENLFTNLSPEPHLSKEQKSTIFDFSELEIIFNDFNNVTDKLILSTIKNESQLLKARQLFDTIFHNYLNQFHTNHNTQLNYIEQLAHNIQNRTSLMFTLQLIISIIITLILIFFSINRFLIPFQQAKKHVMTDGLTGLYNRRYLDTVLTSVMEQMIKEEKPFTISMMDIDHFKQCNDTYGHQFGDLVIKEIAALAKSSVRSSDYVIRYGGEEFFLLIPGLPKEGVEDLLNKIRKKIKEHTFSITENGNDMSITASFGATSFDTSIKSKTITVEYLVNIADKNLYKAKRSGRNRVIM